MLRFLTICDFPFHRRMMIQREALGPQHRQENAIDSPPPTLPRAQVQEISFYYQTLSNAYQKRLRSHE